MTIDHDTRSALSPSICWDDVTVALHERRKHTVREAVAKHAAKDPAAERARARAGMRAMRARRKAQRGQAVA